MQWLYSTFIELLYRIQLYFLGIRFCERKMVDAEFIDDYVFNIDSSYAITFRCYRKTLIDLLYIRGEIKTFTYTSYFVEAFPDQFAPLVFQSLKNRCIFFNGGTNRFKLEEDKLLPLLAEIYLDFLKTYANRWSSFGGAVV